jgi:hypothetical protein
MTESTSPHIPLSSPLGSLSAPHPAPSDLLEPTQAQTIVQLKADLKSLEKKPPTAFTLLQEIDPSSLHNHVHWPIQVRSLGSDRGFEFTVTELTPRAVFLQTPFFQRTGFILHSTLLQCVLQVPQALVSGEGNPAQKVPFSFLAKVGPHTPVDAASPGFVLQIVQMETDKSHLLSQVLARLRE